MNVASIRFGLHPLYGRQDVGAQVRELSAYPSTHFFTSSLTHHFDYRMFTHPISIVTNRQGMFVNTQRTRCMVPTLMTYSVVIYVFAQKLGSYPLFMNIMIGCFGNA